MNQLRKCLLDVTITSVIVLSCAASAGAQSQLFAASSTSALAVPSTLAIPATLAPPVKKPVPGATRWKISLATLAAANTLDVASSWQKRELNPALTPSSSTFGVQSAVLKMGITGIVIGVEWLAMRHHARPDLYRALSIVNFGSAAALGVVAGHNFTVPVSPR
jgi:hypothetical protein